MQTYKGLTELYNLFKTTLAKGQHYLDPRNDPSGHPQNFAIFEYTLNFQKFYLRGDTTAAAMQSFCDLYDQKTASGKKVSNLLDPDILVAVSNSLRMSGHSDASGLYFVKMK